MADDLESTIRENAQGPAKVSGDAGSVEQHSLADQIPGYDQAQWLKAENRPIYDPKHLKEHGQFTSLLVLTFQVVR